jgi:hypothetical protein
VEPRVYVRDTFALTLWIYYEQVGDVAPADYADALIRLHAGLRQIDLAAPHITDRVAAWAEEIDNREMGGSRQRSVWRRPANLELQPSDHGYRRRASRIMDTIPNSPARFR